MNLIYRVSCLLIVVILSLSAQSQCLQILDGNGNPSATPVWTQCNGNTYTLFIQTNRATGAYTINWGDGNTSSGASLTPPATVSHSYPATLRNYTVTFTETGSGCVVTGLMVLERPVNASISRPMGSGGVTTICAPDELGFINSSTDVSINTTFRWDFGDGSPVITKNYTDSGQTNNHTYQRNTVNCNTTVRLEAENYCTVTPSFATVGPINVYDLDDAAITTTNFLCYPDTEVTVLNSSNLNCRPQGNTVQRYEYWNFGNHWGTGSDSLMGWIPFANPPSLAHPLAFPGKGSYTVTLYDSNMCGIDTTTTTIVIGDPPVAAFTTDKDTVCSGGRIRFFNNSTGGANISYWDFGDGVWRQRNMNNQNRRFNTPGLYTIRLAVVNSGGSQSCTDTVSRQVYVLAGPIADFTLNPSSGCDSITVAIIENSSSAAQWLWDFGDGTTDTSSNPLAHTYDSIGAYTITLDVTHSNGCTDNTSETVNVYGSPIVAFSPNNVCEDVVASFTDNSTSPGGDPLTSWSWDFGDGGSSTNQNPTHQYDSSGTFTLVLTVSTAFCTSTDSFPIVVEPKPTANFVMSDSLGCSPLGVSFSNTSLVSSRYYWDFGDGDTSTATSPTHFFYNNTSATVGYEITLIASTTFGCSDTISDSVHVYDVPTSSFTSTAVPMCGPSTVHFTSTVTRANTNLLWLFGDGDTSTATNPSHTYQNKTLFIENYTAKLVTTSSNGCTDTSQQIIVVYPEPIFTFQAIPDSGCSPLAVTFPAVTGAVTYKWYFGDGDSATGSSPTHIYYNTTTNNVIYTVTLIATSSFGCSDTNTGDVVVHPNPDSKFLVSDSVNCQPHDFIIFNNSTGGVRYHWDFGNGDTSDTSASVFPYTYTHNNSTATNYNLSLITYTQEGCADTATKLMTTYPQIHADFNLSDSAGCTPLAVTFTNNSTGAQFNAWEFGDGSTSITTSPSYTYFNNTLRDTLFYPKLVVTSAFNCVDSIQDTVLVHPRPSASFTKDKINGCHPLPVTFTNTSSIADTSFWFFGDGNSSFTNNSTVQHTYTNRTTSSILNTVNLIVRTQHGCADSANQTVDVYPEIISKFGKSDSAGCTDLTVNFSDQSTGAQFYTWLFGDGNSSSNTNVSHTYVNSSLKDTSFEVEFVVRSSYGCVDTSMDTIVVYPRPISSFNMDKIRGCQPMDVQFTDNSVLAVNRVWDFGDGDTSHAANSVTHTFTHTSNTPQDFDINLMVESIHGCLDTSTKTIEVFPAIQAGFSVPDTAGCSDFSVQFTNTSTGESQYEWDFDDGTTERISDPLHVFSSTDTLDKIFNVQLKVKSIYGCEDSVSTNITVYPTPRASFVPTPINQKFPNATVSVTNLSNQGPWSYLWSFGDTGTSTVRDPAPHTYSTWGSFDIVLLVTTANCSDTANQEITIEPPKAVVDFQASGQGCRPLTVTIQNNTLYGKDYLWNFGDGGSSTLENPPPYTYYNAGTYTISLTVVGFDDGVETVFKDDSVIVQENAIALFDYRPDQVSIPSHPVILYNLSQHSDRWFWDFGDSNTSEEKNPEYYYSNAGTYTITLVADNEYGCKDTFSVVNAVEAIAVGKLKFPTAFTPQDGGPTGGVYDPNTLDNTIFFPIQEGVIEYEMFVFNRWGEMVFTTKEIGQGWDGYYRDGSTMCPQDVYVWKVIGKFANGQNFEQAGEVTLLR